MKNDMISRQAALDFVSSMNACEEIRDEVYQKLTVYLENLPPAQPGWIPCNVKKPTVRTDVLLQFKENMAVGFYSHGDWNINTGDGFYTGLVAGDEQPIAWMPLPAKPWEGDANDT